ncbi:MAG: hypothetical protein ACT4OO_14265 [Nitrospiraceae bacterium]
MPWRNANKALKEKKVHRKPKIRWHQLGLNDPALEKNSATMEEIRQQVVALASRGLGQGVRSRSAEQTIHKTKSPRQGTVLPRRRMTVD